MRVVITGATGGIGFAVAEAFAKAGNEVVLADLNEAPCSKKRLYSPLQAGKLTNRVSYQRGTD
ncbi:hypothetical protein ALON55S_04968 [Alishewanella longhuensis]